MPRGTSIRLLATMVAAMFVAGALFLGSGVSARTIQLPARVSVQAQHVTNAVTVGHKKKKKKKKNVITAGERRFASNMRTIFNFKSSVSTTSLYLFGLVVCGALKGGTALPAEVPSVQQDWTNTTTGDAIQMITLAARDMCPAEVPAPTITYVVTGDSADVTYGAAGSDDQGNVPMTVTQPLSNPSYYSISAQLNGYGTVNCALEVDGVAISTASASGGYNIASCEISQALNGTWANTN